MYTPKKFILNETLLHYTEFDTTMPCNMRLFIFYSKTKDKPTSKNEICTFVNIAGLCLLMFFRLFFLTSILT
jgi:hypothetical protein